MDEPETPDGPPHLPTPAEPEEKPAETPTPEPDKPTHPRWLLVRDVAVFQGKLALDALRDLFLSPVSLIAALVGVLTKPEEPGHYFYDLMRWGRRSDHFINLFSAGQEKSERDEHLSVDDLVEHLEKVVVNEHERGGMTAEAKAHIDKTLDKLDEAITPDRVRFTRGIKRAAATMRREVRKVTGRGRGPDGSDGPEAS